MQGGCVTTIVVPSVENPARAAELLEAARDAHQQSGNAAGALSASYLLASAQQRQRQSRASSGGEFSPGL